MKAKLSFLKSALLLGLLVVSTPVAVASEPDFSNLQCPTLIELRMEMLVRYGYCPRDRFYARVFENEIAGCDPSLSDLQVQDKILNGDDTPEADKKRYNLLLRFLTRNNCEI